jgi:hypothetical protein
MKFTKPSVAYLHAARGFFPTVPEPEKSQPRFKHRVDGDTENVLVGFVPRPDAVVVEPVGFLLGLVKPSWCRSRKRLPSQSITFASLVSPVGGISDIPYSLKWRDSGQN